MSLKKHYLLFGIFLISFLFSTQISIAQTYADMPKEVQAQMDLNKVNGVDQWNNINMVYEVVATGLDADENKILLERAKNNSNIISAEFSATGSVIIVCKSGTEFVNVKYIFSEIVSGISSIKSSGSLIKTENK